MATKFYCEECDKHTPVEIERACKDELNELPWGDVVCKICGLVIATYSADCQGRLMFVADE